LKLVYSHTLCLLTRLVYTLQQQSFNIPSSRTTCWVSSRKNDHPLPHSFLILNGYWPIYMHNFLPLLQCISSFINQLVELSALAIFFYSISLSFLQSATVYNPTFLAGSFSSFCKTRARLLHPTRGAKCCGELFCMYLCLLTITAQRPHVQTSQNFLCMWWSWLGSRLTAVQYVMYFWFCRCHVMVIICLNACQLACVMPPRPQLQSCH